jgi:hypothetical protein
VVVEIGALPTVCEWASGRARAAQPCLCEFCDCDFEGLKDAPHNRRVEVYNRELEAFGTLFGQTLVSYSVLNFEEGPKSQI